MPDAAAAREQSRAYALHSMWARLLPGARSAARETVHPFRDIPDFPLWGLREIELNYERLLAGASDGAVRVAGSDSTIGFSKCRGRKNALAISVGTTALATTAATTAEYCALVITPCDNPNSAEIVPNVRPVDISRVV